MDPDYLDRESIWKQEAAAEAAIRLREIIHKEHQTGLLESAIISGSDSRAPFWDNIDDSYQKLGKIIAPWYDWTESKVTEATGNETEQWEAVFGKMDSEEVKAEVEKMKSFKPKPNRTDSLVKYI